MMQAPAAVVVKLQRPKAPPWMPVLLLPTASLPSQLQPHPQPPLPHLKMASYLKLWIPLPSLPGRACGSNQCEFSTFPFDGFCSNGPESPTRAPYVGLSVHISARCNNQYTVQCTPPSSLLFLDGTGTHIITITSGILRPIHRDSIRFTPQTHISHSALAHRSVDWPFWLS